MRIKVRDKITYNELMKFFKEMDSVKKGKLSVSDIFHYTWRTKRQERHVLKHSTYITAREKDKLIGLIRLVEDFGYIYYIAEVMIMPKFQRQGIGTMLMKKTLAYCKQNGFIKIFLITVPGRESFYCNSGFKKAMSKNFEIKFKKVKRKI